VLAAYLPLYWYRVHVEDKKHMDTPVAPAVVPGS
jgi:hypothetical protein